VQTVSVENQDETIRFLESPATYGGERVDRVDTHASIIFLAGGRALKLKRAVRYDFLDFSTVARRGEMCAAEYRINRPLAPAIYRGVLPITRNRRGELALGGEGDTVDWVIDMTRFDQEQLFDRLAERQQLPVEWMRPLGTEIARFHSAAARQDSDGAAGTAWVIDGNESAFATQSGEVLDAGRCGEVIRLSRSWLGRTTPILEQRCRVGRVRECHGDLHLRNIVSLNGTPTLFDAVEFNPRISCIDVLYDLAFLLMDLWHRELRVHANAVWNAYLAETTDVADLSILPLFLSCRAAVRAKVDAIESRVQRDAARRAQLERAARQYLDLAHDLLRPPPPRVIAVGGLSGSGKSTLARALAADLGAAPGAVVLRSDEIRKQLCGVGPLDRLGTAAYTPEMSQRVYDTILERTRAVIAGGHAAIVDAVSQREQDRDAIERTVVDAGVPFAGLWLDAPETVLVARAGQRRLDASDADAAVIRRQLQQEEGAVRWLRLDAAATPETVLAAAREAIRGRWGRGRL
jgi:aminoglycoside phosphotransferase family enzyme/predicted kinase